MISGFDPGALLGASYDLGDGVRIRLRIVAPSDAGAVRELARACGSPGAELVAERLVRFDPRRRAVMCAMALLAGAEVLVGVGAIDLSGSDGSALPNPVLIDERAPAGVGDLLAGALRGRAQARAARRAA